MRPTVLDSLVKEIHMDIKINTALNKKKKKLNILFGKKGWTLIA